VVLLLLLLFHSRPLGNSLSFAWRGRIWKWRWYMTCRPKRLESVSYITSIKPFNGL
jgi:hypothetical protein